MGLLHCLCSVIRFQLQVLLIFRRSVTVIMYSVQPKENHSRQTVNPSIGITWRSIRKDQDRFLKIPLSGLIRIKGLPLARGLIQQGKDILGETDGVFEDALSEINSRENQNTGTIEKAMAGCKVVIALLWDLFQWLPSQQGKPEYSQSSSLVAMGSSLEIILPLYDLTYNLLTGKNSPKSLAGLR